MFPVGSSKPQPQKGVEEGPSVANQNREQTARDYQDDQNYRNHYLTYFLCTGAILFLFIILTFTSIYTIFVSSANYNTLNQNQDLLVRIDNIIFSNFLSQNQLKSPVIQNSKSSDGLIIGDDSDEPVLPEESISLAIPSQQMKINSLLRSKRVMRDLKKENAPCPNPPEEQNKNPVAILQLHVGSEANYECKTLCLSPHINLAELTIDNENGKWAFNASTKKSAKHHVAYLAIKELFPELEDDLIYDPIENSNKHCKVPAKDQSSTNC